MPARRVLGPALACAVALVGCAQSASKPVNFSDATRNYRPSDYHRSTKLDTTREAVAGGGHSHRSVGDLQELGFPPGLCVVLRQHL